MRLGAAVRASCWMVSPVMVAVVCEWLKNGSAKQLLEAQRREIVIRTRMALDKLKDFQIASVDGGLHIWLNLPEPWHADEFVEAARKKGVLILGATTFSISRTHTYHAVRISLSAVANQQKMEEGIDILVTLLKEELPEQEFTVF